MADTKDSREKQREYRTAHSRAWRAANPSRSSYIQQKSNAKRRGIPFLLTFEDWWAIWQASGKWEQRGKLAGQYVMARYGDVGPYASGNVRICTSGANQQEHHFGKIASSETRKRISQLHRGKVVSSETREKLAEAQRRNPSQRDAATGQFTGRRHGTSTF